MWGALKSPKRGKRGPQSEHRRKARTEKRTKKPVRKKEEKLKGEGELYKGTLKSVSKSGNKHKHAERIKVRNGPPRDSCQQSHKKLLPTGACAGTKQTKTLKQHSAGSGDVKSGGVANTPRKVKKKS